MSPFQSAAIQLAAIQVPLSPAQCLGSHRGTESLNKCFSMAYATDKVESSAAALAHGQAKVIHEDGRALTYTHQKTFSRRDSVPGSGELAISIRVLVLYLAVDCAFVHPSQSSSHSGRLPWTKKISMMCDRLCTKNGIIMADSKWRCK